MNLQLRKPALLLGFAFLTASAAFAARVPEPATGGRATITVTAIGKKDSVPPDITKNDVQLTVDKQRKQIADWSKGDALGLAILIDDALDTNAAGQWSDVKNFIMEQPPNTAVAVAYASNSTAIIAQEFTTDHALAAKALRIPRGNIGAGSSIYLSILDLMKRWQGNGGRRSLLVVSSGIDYLRGGFGPFYPDVDTIVSRAQRENINVWSIYYPTVGHRSRSFFIANTGQNNLSKMTDSTGGETYFLGSGAPVSFKPYLDEIQMHLSNQYLLTFAGDGGSKGKYTRIQLKTETPDVEFSHADDAYIAPSK